MIVCVIISPGVYGQELANDQEIEVERLLKRLNKPALISIKSEDGDIIDCVPIHSQLAFDHPLLKNHTIQMRPSFTPESTSTATYTMNKRKATQAWNKNGRCPENTVAIRRIMKEDILRSKSIENFGKKTTQGILLYGANAIHEYAVMRAAPGTFFGTRFVLNVWEPYVQYDTEFSLAQTWLVSGSGSNLNSIEAGFQVYKQKYGDKQLRLFVFWTPNGYPTSRGCYNTDCPGFVQVSKNLIVGGAFKPVSQYNGTQIEVIVTIWKETGGYRSTMKLLVNDNIGGRHTNTKMGSGEFAEQGYKKASFFRNITTTDQYNRPVEPQVSTIATKVNCYNIKQGASGTSWGVNFYYGGPGGQNANCR
uniref:Neprosin PEP catalytic domain-containing protein n=1 Tax=Brassica oleracea var. oleracea TaxID=109376 RepID=A0A0D3BPT5_BRAOL